MSSINEIDPSLIASLDDASKQEVAQYIQAESSKAKIQNSVTNFTDMCFKKCITNVNTGDLLPQEDTCINDCVNRFLDVNIKIVQMLQSLQK
ncbi:unnamed protein product [[Candida] boidinii]|uniref:Mitochondrial import inner membrane translocase subunit n=1 Tax=Candida boidinii TaxID=5477 RepID=A0A9W6WFM4_CANBO|nr:hypothetical protein BVG19_g4507 [[Candida] boidinii]OWB53735.1 hypothetical protein B5S27_g5343 [[Candida] boidinii]OWB69989.1 hypothetical protein B5S30_g5433 [[Candida] boidinii]OWB86224.1 hypothetical protein B5S33_g4908 [[Candida] boidinii]GME67390.1 unnamed protein product [[Candida] boidinii]